MGEASVIDSTLNNFVLPIVCRHMEYRIDVFTSLDLGMSGKERCRVRGTSDVFWKTALS